MAVYDEEQKDNNSLKSGSPLDKAESAVHAAKAASNIYSAGKAAKGYYDKKKADRDDMRQAETNPENAFGETQQSTDPKSVADRVGIGYTGAKSAVQMADLLSGGKVSKAQTSIKRRVAVVGVVGVSVIAGLIFAFSVLQGAAAIVQFAKVLQQVHTAGDQVFIAHRAGMLIRFAHTTNDRQARNMSYFGNKVAVHYEAKLKAAGITPEYGVRRIQAIRIDPSTSEGKEALRKLQVQGINTAELQPGSDGRVRISLENRSASFRRQTLYGVTNTLNINTISYAMGSRVLGARAGVNFHPLKNLVRAADEDFRQYRERAKAEREKQRTLGVDKAARTASAGQSVDSEGQPVSNPEDTASANAANEVGEEARSQVPMDEKVEKLKGKIKSGGAKGVGAVGYIALVCAVDGLGDAADDIRQTNIVLPLIRTGMDIQAMGSQIQAGATQDVNADEVGAVSEDLYDEKTKTSYTQGRAFQAGIGEEQTGPDLPDSAKPGKDKPAFFATLDEVLNAVPLANETCGAVNSTAGGIALTAFGVGINATGPFSAILNGGSAAAQYLLADLFIEDVLRWVAGEQVDGSPAGAQLGNYASYGSRLAANEVMISQGGAELTDEETQQWAALVDDSKRKELEHSSYFARYLDPYSIDSLAGKAIMKGPDMSNTTSTIASLVRLPGTIVGSFSGTLNKLTPATNAATRSYDYGFPKYGFTVAEMNSEQYEDPYENAKIVEPQLAELNTKYGEPCFGTTVDPGTFAINNKLEGGKKYAEIPDECKDKSNEMLTRYRFYIADLTTVNCLANYEGLDDEGCGSEGNAQAQQAGTATAAIASVNIDVGKLKEPSVDVACAAGTDDIGDYDGYTDGKKLKIKLCAIPNIESSGQESNGGFGVRGGDGRVVVNSRVSGAFFELSKAAKADNIKLSALSSFRSMAHQEKLCRENAQCAAGNNVAVAKPGYSNHQLGVAVDFNIPGIGFGIANCIDVGGKCTAKGKPHWEWLDKNASKFGLKQYVNEFWHFSPLENE